MVPVDEELGSREYASLTTDNFVDILKSFFPQGREKTRSLSSLHPRMLRTPLFSFAWCLQGMGRGPLQVFPKM